MSSSSSVATPQGKPGHAPASPAPPPHPPSKDGKGGGNRNGQADPHDQHGARGPVPATATAAPPASDGHDEIPKDLRRPSTLAVAAVAFVVVALLAALFVVGYVPHEHRIKQAEADAADRSNTAPAVDVMSPKPAETDKDVVLPADVRAMQETAIFPRSNGYLKSFSADIGDTVKAGKVLAVIEAPDVDAQLAQARANLDQSRANVNKAQADAEIARRTLERFEQWDKASHGVSQQDLDDKRAAYQDAQAVLEQARANVASAEAAVRQAAVLQGFEQVPAPFTGVITARNYDVGALLSPATTSGKEMFRIAQTDVLRVFVNVPQTYATAIKTGQPAFLSVRNYAGKEFQGTIARTAGALDPTTRTMPFELHFPNPDGELYPGMYGQVRLPVTNARPVLVIPTSALVFDAGGLKVALVRDGKAHFQKITPGRDLGTEMEVVAGLSPEDQIVTNPGERLGEGVAVDVGSPAGGGDGKQPGPRTAVAN